MTRKQATVGRRVALKWTHYPWMGKRGMRGEIAAVERWGRRTRILVRTDDGLFVQDCGLAQLTVVK